MRAVLLFVGCLGVDLAGLAGVGCLGDPHDDPVVVASGQGNPTALALGHGGVYWINSDAQGGVYKVAPSGGQIVVLYSGSMAGISSLALDDTAAYFPTGTAVLAVPLKGGASWTVASTTSKSIAVANGGLYYLEGGAVEVVAVPYSYGGRLSRTVLPTQNVFAARVVDEANTYYVANGELDVLPRDGVASRIATVGSPALGADGSALYVVGTDGAILSIDKFTHATKSLARGQLNVTSIAVSASSVYWSSAGGTIKMAPK